FKLAEAPDTDLTRLFRHFEVDPSRLQAELTRAIDRFRTGNARTPLLSTQIDDLIRGAWVIASIQYRASEVRSGVLLLALLSDGKLGRRAREAARELAKVSFESLWAALPAIVAGSPEDRQATDEPAARGPAEGADGPSKTPALDRYTIDLTGRARTG